MKKIRKMSSFQEQRRMRRLGTERTGNVQIDELLMEGRIERANPGAITRLYRTVHPASGTRRFNGPNRADGSRYTRTSPGARRAARRARERAAKLARRRNRRG